MAVAAFRTDLHVEPAFTPLLSPRVFSRIRDRLDETTAAFVSQQLLTFRDRVALPLLQEASPKAALDAFERKRDLVAAIFFSIQRLLLHPLRLSHTLHDELLGAGEEASHHCHPVANRFLGLRAATTLACALRRTANANRRLCRLLSLPTMAPERFGLQVIYRDPRSLLERSYRSLLADGLALVCLVALDEESVALARSPGVLRGLIDLTWEACFQHETATNAWVLASLNHLPHVGVEGSALATELQGSQSPETAFRSLWSDWKQATRHLSHPRQIVNHPAYQAIVQMGRDALPFIVRDLCSEEPDFWGPALTQITHVEEHPPPEQAQTIRGVADFWLALAERHGWEAA